MSPNPSALLEVQGLGVQFGGIAALRDLTFSVQAGSIHGIIGPNGAGKTTLFNCLSRFVDPTSGSIRLAGKNLLDLPAFAMAGRGIGRTFQNVALFRELSVRENVAIGTHSVTSAGFLAALFRLRRGKREPDGRVRRGNEDNFLLLDLTTPRTWSGSDGPVGPSEMNQFPLGEQGLVLVVSDGMNHLFSLKSTRRELNMSRLEHVGARCRCSRLIPLIAQRSWCRLLFTRTLAQPVSPILPPGA